MTSQFKHLRYLIVWLLLLPGFATGNESSGAEFLQGSISAGYNPAIGTLEYDLWMSLSKVEQDLARSPLLIQDPALNEYVNRVVCRLEPHVCKDIRVYLVRNPTFNASMYPNGMMLVHSGLLLRLENEAQLAAVVGHELGHYLRQHSLQNWQSAKSNANAGIIISVVTAAAGVGAVGDLINLGILSQIFRYQRSHETEADTFGTQRMKVAGYDPSQAAAVWKYIETEERDAIYKEKQPLIFRSHPRSDERFEALTNLATDLGAEGEAFRDNYWQALMPHYLRFVDDELKTNKPGRMRTLLRAHETYSVPPMLVNMAWGEFHKSHDSDNLELALHSFTAASQSSDIGPEVWREIGILQMKLKQYEEAKQSLSYYLSVKPNAEDAAIITYYLSSLENK